MSDNKIISFMETTVHRPIATSAVTSTTPLKIYEVYVEKIN